MSERLKPYLLCIFVSFCHGGFNIISKLSLDKGISLYVLTAYGYVFGAATSAVLALLFERKNRSKLNLPVCINIFLLSSITVLSRILAYSGLEYTSAAFAASMSNLSPSMTFLLAIFCRMEKLNLVKIGGLTKIGGTIVAFGGAAIMTLYKGVNVLSFHHHNHHNSKSRISSEKHFLKGSVILIVQNVAVAAFYIIQTTTLKKYPAPITLTSLINLVGTLLATITAAILDHKASWKLSWNTTLVAPLYAGIVVFGITIYVQAVVIQEKGPVFVTAFRPLATVIATIMGLLILGEVLYLGGVIGAILIILSLYAIVWGKEHERKKRLVQSAISDPSS